METFKRILAGIVIAVSILGLILCLVGIVGVWVVNTPLTDNLTGALDRAEATLVFSQERLDLVVTELTAAEELLANLEEVVSEAEKTLTENSPTLTFISNTVGAELKPKIERMAEVVATLRGTIVSVNSTLETANSIPFVSVPMLPMEELSALDEQLQGAVASVKSLGETIKDVEAGVIERTKTTILVPVDKVSKLIDQVLTPAQTFSDTLGRVKNGVVDANARIPAMIDGASILITFVLAWFALAQASLLYGGWYYWKTGTLPAVQGPSNQISQETQNETDSSDTH